MDFENFDDSNSDSDDESLFTDSDDDDDSYLSNPGNSEYESSSEFENDIDSDREIDEIGSDDDQANCCHWSIRKDVQNKEEDFGKENLSEFCFPTVPFDDGTKRNDMVERIMDETFIRKCIDATKEHGNNDDNYLEKNQRDTTRRERYLVCMWIFGNKMATPAN